MVTDQSTNTTTTVATTTPSSTTTGNMTVNATNLTTNLTTTMQNTTTSNATNTVNTLAMVSNSIKNLFNYSNNATRLAASSDAASMDDAIDNAEDLLTEFTMSTSVSPSEIQKLTELINFAKAFQALGPYFTDFSMNDLPVSNYNMTDLQNTNSTINALNITNPGYKQILDNFLTRIADAYQNSAGDCPYCNTKSSSDGFQTISKQNISDPPTIINGTIASYASYNVSIRQNGTIGKGRYTLCGVPSSNATFVTCIYYNQNKTKIKRFRLLQKPWSCNVTDDIIPYVDKLEMRVFGVNSTLNDSHVDFCGVFVSSSKRGYTVSPYFLQNDTVDNYNNVDQQSNTLNGPSLGSETEYMSGQGNDAAQMNPSLISSCDQTAPLIIMSNSPNLLVQNNTWQIDVDQTHSSPVLIDSVRMIIPGQPLTEPVLLKLIDANQQEIGSYESQIDRDKTLIFPNIPSVPVSNVQLQFPDGTQSDSYTAYILTCSQTNDLPSPNDVSGDQSSVPSDSSSVENNPDSEPTDTSDTASQDQSEQAPPNDDAPSDNSGGQPEPADQQISPSSPAQGQFEQNNQQVSSLPSDQNQQAPSSSPGQRQRSNKMPSPGRYMGPYGTSNRRGPFSAPGYNNNQQTNNMPMYGQKPSFGQNNYNPGQQVPPITMRYTNEEVPCTLYVIRSGSRRIIANTSDDETVTWVLQVPSKPGFISVPNCLSVHKTSFDQLTVNYMNADQTYAEMPNGTALEFVSGPDMNDISTFPEHIPAQMLEVNIDGAPSPLPPPSLEVHMIICFEPMSAVQSQQQDPATQFQQSQQSNSQYQQQPSWAQQQQQQRPSQQYQQSPWAQQQRPYQQSNSQYQQRQPWTQQQQQQQQQRPYQQSNSQYQQQQPWSQQQQQQRPYRQSNSQYQQQQQRPYQQSNSQYQQQQPWAQQQQRPYQQSNSQYQQQQPWAQQQQQRPYQQSNSQYQQRQPWTQQQQPQQSNSQSQQRRPWAQQQQQQQQQSFPQYQQPFQQMQRPPKPSRQPMQYQSPQQSVSRAPQLQGQQYRPPITTPMTPTTNNVNTTTNNASITPTNSGYCNCNCQCPYGAANPEIQGANVVYEYSPPSPPSQQQQTAQRRRRQSDIDSHSILFGK
ncbi:unnamed protein product [Adineta steineri]|uniref:Uncharacterized protein n=2 Tax=Adineta steineri TaxID=433720 RepID=A0A815S258_9BILA|nr:unnamed protein product [Adineta steineri]